MVGEENSSQYGESNGRARIAFRYIGSQINFNKLDLINLEDGDDEDPQDANFHFIHRKLPERSAGKPLQ
jgi:hypothetical protein